MSILRRCRGSCRNPRRCLEHLWFDVMYAGARYRMAANEFAVPRMEPGRQRPIESMEEARQWERLFIGEIQAGRDPRLAAEATSGHRGDAEDRLRVPRRLHGTLRQAGGASQPAVGAEPRVGAEEAPRRAAARRARGAGRDQRVQDRVGLRRGGRDRDGPPRARAAARGDELGHGADATAVHQVAVPPVRRAHEQEAGDHPGSPADARRGEAAARHGAPEDERRRAPVRRAAAARPHHRRARAVLPARRDAADPEQARELGDLPDRHPGRDDEGQGEPARPVQPEGTTGGDPRSDARRSVRTRSCSARRRASTSRTSRRRGRR